VSYLKEENDGKARWNPFHRVKDSEKPPKRHHPGRQLLAILVEMLNVPVAA
jgi:hypothetical protein